MQAQKDNFITKSGIASAIKFIVTYLVGNLYWPNQEYRHSMYVISNQPKYHYGKENSKKGKENSYQEYN